MDSNRISVKAGGASSLSPSRYSLTPSNSEKSLRLRLDHFSTDNSQSISTPRTHMRHESESHKPISLVIIEKYFSDICQSMSEKDTIDPGLQVKANTMQDVLKDCLTAVPDLSLQFYVLMASALKEIQHIYLTKEEHVYSTLAKKLVQLAELIEENKYTSKTERAYTQPQEELQEITGFHEVARELNVKVARVTARILNLWKRILCPQREAAVISCGFLLLYCEVDPTLKISPTARIPIDKAIGVMKNYIANPGYVVTILRKTKEYIDKEMISVETIRRINDLLSKITVEQVKNVDRTLTGLAIYELIIFAVKYYQGYAKEHYNIDIFEKAGFEGSESDSITAKETPLEVNHVNNFEPRPEKIANKLNLSERMQDQEFNIPTRSNPGVTTEENSKKSIGIIPGREVRSSASATSHKKLQISPNKPSNPKKKSQTLDETSPKKKLLNTSEQSMQPSLKNIFKPVPSPTRPKVFAPSSSIPSQVKKPLNPKLASPEKILPEKFSPEKVNSFKSTVKIEADSPITVSSKPLDKNIIAAKKLIISNSKLSNSNKTTPVRSRKNLMNPRSSDPSPINHRDVLEEMQYQQFIEEKFRHFLIDKLQKETEKLLKNGLDRNDIKIVNEIKASKSKMAWIEEFEKTTGIIRFNATKKLSDDKRYTAELIRAQKQLDILERYSN